MTSWSGRDAPSTLTTSSASVDDLWVSRHLHYFLTRTPDSSALLSCSCSALSLCFWGWTDPAGVQTRVHTTALHHLTSHRSANRWPVRGKSSDLNAERPSRLCSSFPSFRSVLSSQTYFSTLALEIAMPHSVSPAPTTTSGSAPNVPVARPPSQQGPVVLEQNGGGHSRSNSATRQANGTGRRRGSTSGRDHRSEGLDLGHR